MLKVLAVLRTLFLIFIAVYTARAMPWFTSVPRTLDEQYSRIAATADLTTRAAWIAVAWIGLETVIGWLWAWRAAKKKALASPTPSATV